MIFLNTDIYNASQQFKKWLIWSIFLYSSLVFNFLEPFEISTNSFIPAYHLVLTCHAVISLLVVYLLESYVQPLLKKRIGQWNLWVSLFWYGFMVFVISVSNWLFILLIHYTISGWHGIQVPNRGFMYIVPKFLSIYFVWAILSAMSCFFLFSRKIENSHSEKLDQKVTLLSENQSDNFRIAEKNIICFKTCDNYLELFYLNEDKQLMNRLIRSSMKRMMVQLNSQNFYRCHQSFLINKAHIKGLIRIKNQSFIELAYLDFNVNVSRGNVKQIKTLLAS
jgi:hypothetical protein